MKTIYLAIKQRLMKEVPSLREVSLDTGQLSISYSETSRPPVALPACLITIDVVQAEELTPDVQRCRTRVTVTFVTDLLREDKSEEPYEVVAEIYRALQGFGTEDFAPLSRRSATKERGVGNKTLFVHRTVFETEYIDETARR